MSTIWDFISIAIFSGVIVLFLQRSIGDEAVEDDSMWNYLGAALGCAVANYLGNQLSAVAGTLAIAGTLAFILYVLRPFPQFPPR